MISPTIALEAAPYRVVRHAAIDSTNAEAIRLAHAGESGNLAIVADRQSAGRGRRGNAWQSPAGNLYVSLLLRPTMAAVHMGEMAFVTAVAVGDVINRTLGAGRAALKWPNDVLVDNAKIAGILIESDLAGDQVAWAVVGVGINVASAPTELPYPAISLHQAGASEATPDEILARFLASFASWQARYVKDGFAPIQQAWQRAAWRLGDTISIEQSEQRLTGRFTGIDPAGALLLDTATGEQRIVSGSLAYVA